ncbi:MAG TPA: hypothetical protein VG405_06145 [Solirubrobacteraceae bacterium]|jgi:hypothetical protein|nr:hypothetical protein [Solirubrobacteraceae bacterium]
MSDSLKATVIVRVRESMISANPELLLELDDDDEPPRLPAVCDPLVEAVLVELLPVELLLAFDPLEEIDWPGLTLSSVAIVPLTGAYSFVLASVCSSESTVAWAWSTEALS